MVAAVFAGVVLAAVAVGFAAAVAGGLAAAFAAAGVVAVLGLAVAADFAGKNDPGGADFQSGWPGPPRVPGNSSGVKPSIACACEKAGRLTFESVRNPHNTVNFLW